MRKLLAVLSCCLWLQVGGTESGVEAATDDVTGPAVVGVVVDAAGSAAGVEVSVDAPPGVETAAVTDATGRYRLDGLPGLGTYRLRYERAGNGSVTSIVYVRGLLTLVERVTLPAEAFVFGTVTDGAGQPVADAEVTLKSTTSSSIPSATVTTAGDGTFRFPALAPGGYSVSSVVADGFDFWYAASEDDGVLGVRVQVTAGQTTVLGLKLARSTALSGRVTNDRGEPVVGARLVHRGIDFRTLTYTDADGRYATIAPPSGQLSVLDDSGFHSGWTAPLTLVEGTSTTVNVVLRSLTATLEGRIVDDTGAPLEGREVGRQSITGHDGVFSVKVLAPLGELLVSQPEFDFPLRISYPGLAVGETRNVGDVVLERTGGISGVVLHSDGDPVKGMSVVANSDGLVFPGGRAVTGEDGTFTIGGLKGASFRVCTSFSGLVYECFDDVGTAAEATLIDVRPGVTTALPAIVVGARPTLVRGVVRDNDGQPLPNVALKPFKASGSLSGEPTVYSDDDGHYEMPLNPGIYTIKPGQSNGTWLVEPVTVEVAVGQIIELDVTASPGPVVTGVLRSADGSEASATLTLVRRDGSGSTTFGGAGQFSVNIASGEWTIRFDYGLTNNSETPFHEYFDDAFDPALATFLDFKPGDVIDLGEIILGPDPDLPPVAVDDSAEAVEGFPAVAIDALANDTDPESAPLTIVGNTAGERGGAVTCDTTTCRYQPIDGVDDTDRFSYTITDGTTETSATVDVVVRPNLEVPEGPGLLTIGYATIVLANDVPATKSTPVKYCIRHVTTSRLDVIARCGRVVVAAGASRAFVPVLVFGDKRDEGPEYAVVEITNEVAVVDRALRVLVIDNDGS